MNRIYAGTPYGHPVLGTIAGIESITLDDVKQFIAEHYTQGNLVIGISGDYPAAMLMAVKAGAAKLPAGKVVAGGLKSLPKIEGHPRNFREFCVEGLEPNLPQIKQYVDESLMVVTALNPVIGYDQAGAIAKKAHHEGTTLREAAMSLGTISAEEFDRVVRPADMITPG